MLSITKAPPHFSALLWPAGVLIAAAAFLWLTVLCYPFIIDDAFISFRYAVNLAQGHGLVFNPGERVEGYTNFLWVVILAGVAWLGGDPLAAARVLGVAANALTLLLIGVTARQWWPQPAFIGLPLLPMLLLAVNFGFVAWGVGGLETALFVCLGTAGLLRLIQEATKLAGPMEHPPPAPAALEQGRGPGKWRFLPQPLPLAACLLVLATLTRPDGVVLFAGGLAGWLGWAATGRRLNRRLMSHGLLMGGLYTLVVGAHLLFRYAYYGDWVPNTTYLKVPEASLFNMHWGRLSDWLRSWGLLDWAVLRGLVPGQPDWWPAILAALTAPAFLLVLIGLYAGRRRPIAWILGMASGIWLLYLALVNEDWMPGWRFYLPITPAVILLIVGGLEALAGGVARWPRRAGRRVARGALLGVAAGLVLLSVQETNTQLPVAQAWGAIAARFRIAGEALRAHAAPQATVAVIDAGAIPYYSGLYTIDYFGLVDKHMARVPLRPLSLDKGDSIMRHYMLRYDTDYLLSRQPDFVQLTGQMTPDGHYQGHQPESVVAYQALRQAGGYDLMHPVYYDGELIFVRRTDVVWRP